MRIEEGGQIQLFEHISEIGENPDHSLSHTGEQFAYKRAMAAGTMAVEQAVASDSLEVHDEATDANN